MFSSAPARVDLESFELPAPAANQIAVRNTRTHVSGGSESNFLRFGPLSYGLKDNNPRANIGYMGVGTVTAVGRDVQGFAVGDRVTTCSNHASHALIDITPTTMIEHVPDGVNDDDAGFVFLAGVALHAVRRAQLQIGQSVAVFGMGLVGQFALQLARLSGAYPLIAVDLVDDRLELAKKSGATHVINPSRENVAERMKEITNGEGVEAIFHCAQAADILQTILECASHKGSVLLTGSPPGTATIRLKEELLRKELTISGTYESGMLQPHVYWRWTRQRNRQVALRLMATGQLQVGHMVTHVVPVQQASAMFDLVLRGGAGWLGIVFKWAD